MRRLLVPLLAALCALSGCDGRPGSVPERPLGPSLAFAVRPGVSPEESAARLDELLLGAGVGRASVDARAKRVVVCALVETESLESARTIGERLLRGGDLEIRLCAPWQIEHEERERRESLGDAYEPPLGWRWLPEMNPLTSTAMGVLVEVPDAAPAGGLGDAGTPVVPSEEARALRAGLVHDRRSRVFGSDDLAVAEARHDDVEHFVHIELVDHRKGAFEEFTRANVGRRLAIIVGGSVASSSEIVGAQPGEIDLRKHVPFTRGEAWILARLLRGAHKPLDGLELLYVVPPEPNYDR